MNKMKLVMVGNGMAGCRTLEELLKLAPDLYDITVFGAEPYPNYNRILLSPVLSGEMSLQDELLGVMEKTGATTVMVTHDVDEAVLLSDRIVMMTNGPAAAIGEILPVDLPRPRNRLALAHDKTFVECRGAVLDFLYRKQLKKAA